MSPMHCLAVVALALLLQSYAVAVFIKKAIVNGVLLIFLLLQELYVALQHLYRFTSTSPTAHIVCTTIFQICYEMLCQLLRLLLGAVWILLELPDIIKI